MRSVTTVPAFLAPCQSRGCAVRRSQYWEEMKTEPKSLTAIRLERVQ